jgi:hypothetical protein
MIDLRGLLGYLILVVQSIAGVPKGSRAPLERYSILMS